MRDATKQAEIMGRLLDGGGRLTEVPRLEIRGGIGKGCRPWFAINASVTRLSTALPPRIC